MQVTMWQCDDVSGWGYVRIWCDMSMYVTMRRWWWWGGNCKKVKWPLMYHDQRTYKWQCDDANMYLDAGHTQVPVRIWCDMSMYVTMWRWWYAWTLPAVVTSGSINAVDIKWPLLIWRDYSNNDHSLKHQRGSDQFQHVTRSAFIVIVLWCVWEPMRGMCLISALSRSDGDVSDLSIRGTVDSMFGAAR